MWPEEAICEKSGSDTNQWSSTNNKTQKHNDNTDNKAQKHKRTTNNKKKHNDITDNKTKKHKHTTNNKTQNKTFVRSQNQWSATKNQKTKLQIFNSVRREVLIQKCST